MSNPTRWRVSRKITATGAVWGDLFTPAEAGDVLNVRQLAVGSDAAVEVVFFFGTASGTTAETGNRDDERSRIFSHEPGANAGAAPDFSCLGAWSPSPGRKVRYWISGAADIHVTIAGTVDE